MKQNLMKTTGALLFMLILLFGMLSFMDSGAERSGFVDINYLFENFKGTLELEHKFVKDQQRPQQLLDSLSLQVSNLTKQSTDKKTIDLINETMSKKQKLTQIMAEQKQELNAEYTQMIWDQINAYIKDFSESHQYDFVFGLTGTGNVMYGNPQKNITKEVLTFINAKYDGE